jgi:hypothetical protein
MNLRYLVLVAALATLFSAHGQQTKTMSGNFSSASFDQLVNAIEQQTNYRLFYKPAWTDSVFVTLTVTNEKVSKVLDQALEGTDLHYSMVENHIYIVKERQ